MAKQTGDILLYGTRQDGNGYIDGEGRPVFRLKPGPERKDWKRKAEFARSRAAAAQFGKDMAAWWAIWRLLPRQMRLLVDEPNGRAGLWHPGWKGGFALHGDAAQLGVDVGLEGPSSPSNPSSPSRASGASGTSGTARDLAGQRRYLDHACGGDGHVDVLRVQGLQSALEGMASPEDMRPRALPEGSPLQDHSFRKRPADHDFLPVAGHHVTGGMGSARSKQRRAVVKALWESGNGLRDRREMEMEKWEALARRKGFSDARDWFAAMRGNLGEGRCNERCDGRCDERGDGRCDERGGGTRLGSLAVGDIRVRVHVCVIHLEDGATPRNPAAPPRWYRLGKWISPREALRIRLPQSGDWRGHRCAVFIGLEFGHVRNLTPGPSPKERGAQGVILPLKCLNRMWFCGQRVIGAPALDVRKSSGGKSLAIPTRRLSRSQRVCRVAVRGSKYGGRGFAGGLPAAPARVQGAGVDVVSGIRAGP